ncbi:MAG: hypothetical protein SFV21_03840, partial [Rhodospirillaceae bacterium]|nr:hypothetical protein [Rhodospirillaceae bacterium]
LLERGQPDAAVAELARLVDQQPRQALFLSNLLLTSQYVPGVTAESLFDLHALWRARFPPPAPLVAAPRDPDPERKLTIAFLSADFAHHAVGYFMRPLVAALPPSACRLIAIASGARRDAVTPLFARLAHDWHDVGETPDAEVAALVATLGVDVLVDMAGHTNGNRLGVFARRAAPVQISWAGYVGTTGVPGIDAVLADAHQAPPEEDRWYHEQVLRLPRCYVPYQPPDYAPEVGPLPADANGHVTFGSMSAPAKLNDQIIGLWARVLATVPGSRLSLRYRGLDSQANRQRITAIMAAAGVAAGRLSFAGLSSHKEVLTAYHGVDIALDPFPYSSGVTACEALYMGVPLVTLRGATFAGRHATTYLSALGLQDLVATTPQAYVAACAGLAGNIAGLRDLRAGLRARMRASALFDYAGYAADFLAAVRRLWREKCAAAGG